MCESQAPSNILTYDLPYREDSSEYFSIIRPMGWPIWLDSGSKHNNQGRFDILSAAPRKQIISDDTGTRCISLPPDAIGSHSIAGSPLATTTFYGNTWAAIRQETPLTPGDPQPAALNQELPFTGGALGYLGYDLGRELEGLKNLKQDDSLLPLALMGVYDWAIVQDHRLQRSTLIVRHQVNPEHTSLLIQRLTTTESQEDPGSAFTITGLKSNTEKGSYLEKVEQIKQYITEGDCYQTNFAQRYSARYEGDLFEAYKVLRQELPSPFSCFFETEYGTVLSLSPERFIQSDGVNILTQPIKGTAPRGASPAEDQRLARSLLDSPKDQAENLMIVDLLRNDLSKVCQPHTVLTPKLFDLESYANVHHLVSTVTGELQPGVTPADVLAACFPGGSITGAPKIRAMEIIEELEVSRRSVYCGSIGYIGFDGKMDTNIAIRTIAANHKELFVWGGGGIVADSAAEQEYQESLTKIGVILETLNNI
ncbi:aminodeoxychorismate synthase component I [Aestuariicella hydrocarbonica]|uniref:aminodeoxychorismate synthase n=1 Tax=Pseudomaricurvus hydrocarbonicus TaxID=1470433 RepID=A0A9E5JRL9_9GAMM|nr:aminodeoxychorismate synthase component I [Aestuariicella hydrocarbonica]NHO65264.1 aminodeoxychorismate synthase component I [Aestuariicella hydrocarbonica]